MMRRLIMTTVTCSVVVVALAGASGALAAESPWWRASSAARPGYLPVGGESADEVQELTVSATEGNVVVAPNEGAVGAALEQKGSEIGFLAWDASQAQAQATLEKAFPGRQLSVSVGEGDTADTHHWVIAFRHQAVPLMFANGSFGLFFGVSPLACEAGLVGCTAEATVSELGAGAATEREIVVQAANLGDAAANGGCVEVPPETGRFLDSGCTEAAVPPAKGGFEERPVSIADLLPSGVRAVRIEGLAAASPAQPQGSSAPVECQLTTLTCTFKGVLAPMALIEVDIGVVVEANAKSSSESHEENRVSVSGGGAAHAVSLSAPITVAQTGQSTPFGVETWQISPEEEGGGADAQAGSHPFQVTFAGQLNQTAGAEPAALPKELLSKLPPGLIGNPSAIPTCNLALFLSESGECPGQTVVGAALVTIREPKSFAGRMDGVGTFTAPVVNLEPQHGEAARFGFKAAGIFPVFLDAHVRSGEDYGVTAGSSDISQVAGVLGFRLVLWGVPADVRHNQAREQQLGFGGALHQSEPPPFFSLPTQCEAPLHTSLIADSWVDPTPHEYAGQPIGRLDGCNALAFNAQVKVTPDAEEASRPTGLNVDVHVDQTSVLAANGLAESNVKDITVTLPEGVAVNPSSGNGLQTCSEHLVGFKGSEEFPLEPGSQQLAFTPRLPGSIPALQAGEGEPLLPGVNFCANASKIGDRRQSTRRCCPPTRRQGRRVSGDPERKPVRQPDRDVHRRRRPRSRAPSSSSPARSALPGAGK